MPSSERPVVGGVYRRELLHSEATYRVVAVEDDHVRVEAVDVPGLPAGHVLRLTAVSVAAMQPVSVPDPVAEPTADAVDRAAEHRLRLA